MSELVSLELALLVIKQLFPHLRPKEVGLGIMQNTSIPSVGKVKDFPEDSPDITLTILVSGNNQLWVI
jgi:hypothetical protein